MRRHTESRSGSFQLVQSVEIDADVERVFARWTRYEDLPLVISSVRRIGRIDDQLLWDAEIAGRQVVWEAQIEECSPPKRVRWESRWGASHSGEVRFEALPDGRTRFAVEIHYRPRGRLERLGARLGLVDAHVRRDLDLFRRFVEDLPRDAS